MKCIKLAAAALNQTPLDWEGNRDNILSAITRARQAGASILCLPELCITGYGAEDAFLSPATSDMAARILFELAPDTRGIIVSLGLPVIHNKAFYNTCCLVADGKVLGFVAKHALAGDGIHYEPRWFKSWPYGYRASVRLFGQEFPFGDFQFDIDGVRIGFEICEDAWMARRSGSSFALEAADIVLNPSASHFAFGKHEIRRRVVFEGARAFGVSYVYSNLLGNEAGRAIYDGDALIVSGGRLLAQAERFQFCDVNIIAAVVDIDLTRSQHARLHRFTPNVEIETVSAEFQFEAVAPQAPSEPKSPLWECSNHIKEEEFARAVALGLFDYLRKSHAQGFVVSLSGGADSSAIAALVWIMTRLAERELGGQGMLARLGLPEESSAGGASVMRRLLTTVYQSTQNSSALTRALAHAVAEAVESTHLELDVDALRAGYESLISKAVGRELTWQEDDLALQNIQARVRAPSVWMLANLNRALLLSTSNRSEAAVGYATMDGDTSGGLSPIAGIDKAYLQRWLRWLSCEGPSGVGPLPALSAVTSQKPTAELRPPDSAQTDEADLMPYDLLDVIERAAIRDKQSPSEVYSLIRTQFPGYSEAQVLGWVERFFVLFSRNQWKRERYAPSFHLDDANLDPKTWCRFPILSGNFRRELEELRRAVERKG